MSGQVPNSCYMCYKNETVKFFDDSGGFTSKKLDNVTLADFQHFSECIPAGFPEVRKNVDSEAIACAENFRASRGMPEGLQWVTFIAVIVFALVLGYVLTRDMRNPRKT